MANPLYCGRCGASLNLLGGCPLNPAHNIEWQDEDIEGPALEPDPEEEA